MVLFQGVNLGVMLIVPAMVILFIVKLSNRRIQDVEQTKISIRYARSSRHGRFGAMELHHLFKMTQPNGHASFGKLFGYPVAFFLLIIVAHGILNWMKAQSSLSDIIQGIQRNHIGQGSFFGRLWGISQLFANVRDAGTYLIN